MIFFLQRNVFYLIKNKKKLNSSGNTNEPSLSASALEGILPETPSGEAQDNDDDDDDGGLNLPSAPSNTLPRGIKPGSSQEKQMEKKNDLDDLAARFERLKRGY